MPGLLLEMILLQRNMLNYIMKMPYQHVSEIQTVEKKDEGRTCRFKETETLLPMWCLNLVDSHLKQTQGENDKQKKI